MFLNLSRLTLRYPNGASERPAVSGLSLSLSAGQIGVLIGPSGCGKTSVLRAVAGLEPVQEGEISVGGDVLSQAGRPPLAPEKRRIGMVFQDYALFPHLSVENNIAFGIQHLSTAERQARVREMLALVGLQGAAQRWPHQLSGGQQQRVALARALAPKPRLLLLDEPFSSLDVDLREHLAQELRSILKAAGTTALFVTHDQQEAFALGDVIGVMQEGQLAQWDDAYTLYHRPRTRFVAEFIGHAVFLPGKLVRQADGKPLVRTALGDLDDADECVLAQAYPDGLCDVLLRADDIVHQDDAPVQARIVRKAFRGADFLYTLELASGETLMAHVPSHHNHAIGEWIGIQPAADHVVTFPAASLPLKPVPSTAGR